MKIGIGCDHVGYELKGKVTEHLRELGYEVVDFGTNSSERTDYPIYGEAVARAVVSGACEKGILICGTGIGMSIAANKIPGIRASVCADEFSTRYTRLHNDANVLCLGARVIGSGLALELADIFLETGFEGGRHQRRLDMITQLEAAHTKGE